MVEINAGNGQLMTIDTAKSKISVALTRVGLLYQSFHTRKSELVLNEDPENVEAVKKFLSDRKEAKKIVEETHKVIKKPYFDAGKAADNAKSEIIALFDEVGTDVEAWYMKYCNEIDRKRREAEEKKQREDKIKSGVEANVLDFAIKIAGCKTRKQLIEVERLINLEKSQSRALKYGDLHEFAINKYNEALLPIIKDQKPKIDEYEKLQDQLYKADNPVNVDELREKFEQTENEILQNQIKVQEQALNQSPLQTNEVEEILPGITKAGSTMTCEIVDEKIVFKKHRELLNIDLKLVETKKIGAMLRDFGEFQGKDELIFEGIKFTIERKWKI
jgi:hypothetical protein